ncbi:MAG TPA: FtsX-like permease family protein [Candidatus Acidoferrales bacterium]|nr:FtsX-like permease family protein [Candidatus Acidoferrales bacterium]
MGILRNLWRRKVRTVLTVAGIVMGIFALTTMGALAEHFNVLLGGGITYYGSSIQVASDTGGGSFGGGYMSLDTVNKIKMIDGVRAVGPAVQVLAKPGSVSAVNFGVPDYVMNYDPASFKYSAFKVTLADGQWTTDSSRFQVTLGSSFAAEFNKHVGDVINLPVRPKDATADFVNHQFTVIGILDKTLTAPDSGAFVSLHDAQMLMGDSLPQAIRTNVDPYSLITGAVAFGKPGVNLDTLANRITATVQGVKATKPSDLVSSFKSGGAVFTFMTTAAALLALIIGGLSVVNTMIMSVTERTREIGLKKAIGAKTRRILGEFLAESTAMGLLGGAIGFVLGLLLTMALNGSDPSGGIFLITPRLTLIALAFAVALGAGAGVVPAMRAARMDPVTALRAQ